jgi:hypothetical protein
MNNSDIDTLQIQVYLEWAVENAMKINPGKSKAVSFTKARVKHLSIIFGVPKNSGSDQMQIFRNNLTQRFKLG